MYNPYPFSAGKSWSPFKTRLFNSFFNLLVISFNWENDDGLDFLRSLRGLQELQIESTRVLDLTPISSCTELKTLIIACKIKKGTHLDFTSLTKLRRYVGVDNGSLTGIYSVESLNRVTLTGYLQKDFTGWNGDNLEHITIDGSKSLESLNGIQNMENLKLVELNNCPRLKRPTLYKNDYPFLRIYFDGEMQEQE